MIWLGLRFKRNAAGTDYFLGSRALGWFPLGMSTMATQLSAVSFVSAPAFVGLRSGGGMQWLTYEFGVPLAMIPLMALIGPMLRRSGVVSVYSFLERRFGRGSRLLLSALFIFSRAFGTGVQIYVIALVLASILMLPFWETIMALGGVTIVYSLKGGLKAIVYSEVAQMIIKVLGIFVIMFTALLIALESPGTVIYRQKRVGRGGKTFTLFKFRSMAMDAEKDGKAAWAAVNDARITRIGRFIRRTRIDELPQLINVLRGEMSLVGPRPERPEFVTMLSEQIPFYALRHSVKPGITGWAQVRHCYVATVDDTVKKLEYDIYYVKNNSLLLDLLILLETVRVVLLGEGAR